MERLREHLLILIGGLDARLHGLISEAAEDAGGLSPAQLLAVTRDRLVGLLEMRQRHLADSDEKEQEFDQQLGEIVEDLSRALDGE